MSVADWKPAKLDELGFVGRGKSRHRPRNAAFLYGGRYPFFQTGDIKAANFYLTDYSQTYSDDGLAQSKLWKPGTLCITIAANIAESAILGVEGCFPDSVVGFVADPDKADVRFIKYYMETLKLRMQNVSHGATQDNLSVDKLLSFDFLVPPLPIQKRIAGILSAYDEIIENSQRRIKILETMARALYREWFVHFRFPGHENHPRVASPLGEIPQGWEMKTVADAFVISGGGTPSRKEDEFWTNGTIQWYSPSDLTRAGTMFIDDSSDHITERGLAQSSARMFPARCVMLTSRATIGAIAINTYPACTNQGFITCLPNEQVPLYYLFHWLTENVQTFQRMASGATFKEISRGVFKTIDFLQPPDELVGRFETLAAPMAEQVLALQRQIQNLRRTRDLLLPRLLSGQIDVETLA
ncbi:restriction endonuclease subunit S [Thiomonas sp. FB-Cd]|uniref:restriction endonuclease subunit S n=1 Tax=Thiomonas sp. FB-Cd TaxID=1158292 RepID=UPI0004DED73F|nr:restriction endonuclease subunit S [Thiomonas sp. FB-Cd]